MPEKPAKAPARSLRPRYISKSYQRGRRTFWGVYDRETASWPINRAEFGMVAQDHLAEDLAQAEADRLNEVGS